MAMVVKNNLSAVRTLNILNSNSAALQKGMARVSSGMKITGAQDDAAGFAISERMRVRIRALDQANQNSQNDSSLMKTAEGAVGNTIDILKALKEKCINAANDSNTDEDRQTIQKEIDQYIDQIDDNALVTFNGKTLIDGSKNNAAIATKTVLLNQSLSTGTKSSDALTDLKSRTDESLGIQSTDYYQVSWVENGKIHTTSGQVGDSTLKNIIDGVGVNGSVVETTKDGLIQAVAPEEVKADPTDGHTVVNDGDPTSPTDLAITSSKDADGNVTLYDTTDIQTMFAGNANVTTAATNTPPEGIEDLGAADGKQYRMLVEDADGNQTMQDVTISLKYHDDDDGSGTAVQGYEVIIKNSNGEELTGVSAANIYTENAPVAPSTYGTAEGTLAEPTVVQYDSDGAGTLADLKVTDARVPASGSTAAGLAEAEKWATALGFVDANGDPVVSKLDGSTNLGDLGYYTKSTGADGSDVYTKADLVITYTSASTTTGNITFMDSNGNNATTGVSLYKLDMSDSQNIKTLAETGLDNLPDTITKAEEATEDAGTLKGVQNKYERDLYTPDKTQGVAVIAKEDGVDNQISGLTISILDQDLNVKKSVNACLDQFKQYQRAENQTGDRALNFQLGSEANQAIKVGLTDMRSQALGLKGSDGTRINVYTKENANAAINVIENAITKALDQQTTIGAVESRLEYTSANLTTASENVQASESTIRDADMAKEMTNYTKANVLLQAAQAMLAQANQSSSSVLSLLQ